MAGAIGPAVHIVGRPLNLKVRVPFQAIAGGGRHPNVDRHIVQGGTAQTDKGIVHIRRPGEAPRRRRKLYGLIEWCVYGRCPDDFLGADMHLGRVFGRTLFIGAGPGIHRERDGVGCGVAVDIYLDDTVVARNGDGATVDGVERAHADIVTGMVSEDDKRRENRGKCAQSDNEENKRAALARRRCRKHAFCLSDCFVTLQSYPPDW